MDDVVTDPIAHLVYAYLRNVLVDMTVRPSTTSTSSRIDHELLASEIFSVLTGRAFCYLGRQKVEYYRSDLVNSLSRRLVTGGALRFFYDIGPGYHATTRPGVLPLQYHVGLSELFILAQANALCRRISQLYAPGGRFWLVIDNICALRTNDIPVELTEEYVRQLRRLIEETEMSDTVDLLVESEQFDLEEYDQLLAAIEPRPVDSDPPPLAVENVARFLGRHCTAAEAAERLERYRRTSAVTDDLLNRLVQGVHMTQRATGATVAFRPFPGGDQRTQTGEVALTRGANGRIRPMLLTSRNVDTYDSTRLEYKDLLPTPITHVTFVRPRTA